MTLNKNDIDYRDNSKVRVKTRALVAILVGIFANWTWLFIIIGLFSIGEFFTMKKVLSHSFISDEKIDLSAREKGEITGRALVSAFFAFISTAIIACVIRLLKILILKLF